MGSDETDTAAGVDRRLLAKLLAGGVLAGVSASPTAAQAPPRGPPAPPEKPATVSILIHPGMVMLDLVGPLTVFQIMQADVQLVWKDRSPVMTDTRIPVTPTHDFRDARIGSDLFLIPGGTMGSVACMRDEAVLAHVRAQGDAARYVTSVCTGSLVLAAAGLLKGYRATSLWAVADALPMMGATHVNERIVVDRNRITAGGVTAGIDFGLMLAARLSDERTAKRIQLTLEYSPQPPFKAGTPEEAGAELTAFTKSRRKGMDAEVAAAAREAGKRLGV